MSAPLVRNSEARSKYVDLTSNLYSAFDMWARHGRLDFGKDWSNNQIPNRLDDYIMKLLGFRDAHHFLRDCSADTLETISKLETGGPEAWVFYKVLEARLLK